MSSWVNQNCVNWFQLLCIKVVNTGRLPQHIAFIMDGNRRYAEKKHVDRGVGHAKGYDKLTETLKWCLDLGIPEVTVYAFSIENFKRSDEEVKTLMNLAREKFKRLLDEVDQMREWGIRVHVAGRLSLLPPDVRALISRAMLATIDNNKLRLNIAYAYTGRDEVSRAATQLVRGVQESELQSSDIDVDLVSETLELGEPELLIRTSGESRLSDFMIWQVSNTVLYFKDVFWPDFSIWNLLEAILHFQRSIPAIETGKITKELKDSMSDRKTKFLEKLEERRVKILKEYAAIMI